MFIILMASCSKFVHKSNYQYYHISVIHRKMLKTYLTTEDYEVLRSLLLEPAGEQLVATT